jgi:uncharacterized membrane protein
MKTLIAVIFKHDENAAGRVLNRLQDLEHEYLIDLHDAVIVRRNPNGKLFLQQSVNLAATGAWNGAFWGLLIGMLFAGPVGVVVGGAIGAGVGALSGSSVDYGINDDFIRSLSEDVEPCCSALFVLARSLTVDKLIDELQGSGGRVLKTSLAADVEQRLQDALSKTPA